MVPLPTFSFERFRGELELAPQTTAKRSSSYARRVQNINWIRDLPREDLEYGRSEIGLLLNVTALGERIHIQYPGKESVKTKRRPHPYVWDFRPKVILTDGSYGPDLSFENIWDILFEQLEPIKEASVEIRRVLAILFYRMAYMVDFTKHGNSIRIPTRHVTYDPKEQLADETGRALPMFWGYNPPLKVIQALSEIVPNWGSMSFEAFLHYNNLLAWNEDCKFYYRDTAIRGGSWTGTEGTGRVNTLLTHVRIIGFILDEVKPSTLLGGFSRRRGVSVGMCSPEGEEKGGRIELFRGKEAVLEVHPCKVSFWGVFGGRRTCAGVL